MPVRMLEGNSRPACCGTFWPPRPPRPWAGGCAGCCCAAAMETTASARIHLCFICRSPLCLGALPPRGEVAAPFGADGGEVEHRLFNGRADDFDLLQVAGAEADVLGEAKGAVGGF